MNGRPEAQRNLEAQVERRAERLQRAEREKRSVLAQTVYLGTLGLVFVLPIIGGAYLGEWLDERLAGFSQSWTLSLIALGLVIGGANVWFLLRERT